MKTTLIYTFAAFAASTSLLLADRDQLKDNKEMQAVLDDSKDAAKHLMKAFGDSAKSRNPDAKQVSSQGSKRVKP